MPFTSSMFHPFFTWPTTVIIYHVPVKKFYTPFASLPKYNPNIHAGLTSSRCHTKIYKDAEKFEQEP
jgi:hypothetical protein